MTKLFDTLTEAQQELIATKELELKVDVGTGEIIAKRSGAAGRGRSPRLAVEAIGK